MRQNFFKLWISEWLLWEHLEKMCKTMCIAKGKKYEKKNFFDPFIEG